MDLALEVDSVLHSFGGRAILSDVYLKCNRGKIVGLFGRNGTGKTTLLRIIFGTLKAERSFVRIDGEVVTGRAMQTGLLMYVPQHNIIPNNMNVKKAVRLTLGDVTLFLDKLFYKQMSDSVVSELSHGAKRYLSIILALSSNAPYIILDEPFNAISPLWSDKIRDAIKQVSPNKGIIISDHNYRDVVKVVSRLILLKDCYLFSIESKEDLVKHGYLMTL